MEDLVDSSEVAELSDAVGVSEVSALVVVGVSFVVSVFVFSSAVGVSSVIVFSVDSVSVISVSAGIVSASILEISEDSLLSSGTALSTFWLSFVALSITLSFLFTECSFSFPKHFPPAGVYFSPSTSIVTKEFLSKSFS